MKFCGFELRWKGQKLLIGQPSYAEDLVKRYEGLCPRSVPLPKIDLELREEDISAADIKKAQVIVGELLWLSCRTRPDLSYGTAALGGLVSKCPRQVQDAAIHMLGYVAQSLDFCLCYEPCGGGYGPSGELCLARSMMRIELFSDASFAPAGGKGHQGLLAAYGGGVVQWDSRRQPFAVLSSAEAELLGYTDSVVLGESLAVVIDILEDGRFSAEGEFLLYGDNKAGLQLVQAVDGPWRTRHLRLRGMVLKERIQAKVWKVRHLRGTELAADLLTKAVTNQAVWQSFRTFVALGSADDGASAKLSSLVGRTLAALCALSLCKPVSKVMASVRAVAISAVVANLVQKARSFFPCFGSNSEEGPSRAGSHKHLIGPTTAETGVGPLQSSVETRKDQEPSRASGPLLAAGTGEGPLQSLVEKRDRNPLDPPCMNSGRVVPWIRALRLPEAAVNLREPWNMQRFRSVPDRKTDHWDLELWENGWICRIHGKVRKQPFHPVHGNCPVNAKDLQPDRITVLYDGKGNRRIVHDEWGRHPKWDGTEWRGFTFFQRQLEPRASFPEASAAGDGSSSSMVVEVGRRELIENAEPPYRPEWRPHEEPLGSSSIELLTVSGYGGSDPRISRARERAQAVFETPSHDLETDDWRLIRHDDEGGV